MSAAISAAMPREAPEARFVTVRLGPHWIGLPIAQVQDVFVPQAIAPVPLAPPEVAGLINLRGRVVTAICVRRLMGLPAADPGSCVAIGVERRKDSYALIVDEVGDVVTLGADAFEPTPVHLDASLARFCEGVYRLDDGLLVIIRISALVDDADEALAA
jgi:purine-binding chemotaxis protein CheW